MAKKRTLQSMAYGPGGPPYATDPQTKPINTKVLGDRKKAKESGNKFFDLSRKERREARKAGYGWRNEYWKNPDADTQRFRMEDKGKRNF